MNMKSVGSPQTSDITKTESDITPAILLAKGLEIVSQFTRNKTIYWLSKDL